MIKHPIFKTSFYFGLISAFVAFSFFLFLYWRGADALSISRLAADAFNAFLFIVAAMWYYKRVVRKGLLHLWEGLSIGFLTNLTATLISSTVIYLFITWIDPQVLHTHIHEMQQMLLRNKVKYEIIGQGKVDFNQLVATIGKTTVSNIFWDEVLKKLVVTILVPVVALLLRRQPYSFINPGDQAIKPSIKK